LFDETDVIVAHNGDRLDIKKSNAWFIAYGLKPPSPYITIDTLKIARKYFAFASNKLSDLSRFLKVGKMLEHTGIALWFDCMNPQTNKKDEAVQHSGYCAARTGIREATSMALESSQSHTLYT
jgi:hypothetical protein